MLPERYTYENLKRAIKHPQKFVNEFHRLSSPIHNKIQNIYYTQAKWNGGFLVTDEDWDNLIILDACRADLFENVASLDKFDSYKRKQSIESNTSVWSLKNFKDKELGDVVYVTANPVVSRVASNSFHKLIEVWNNEDVYDENTFSIPPGPVIERAREANQEYPNKRLIIHFVQPHYPFIPRPDLTYRTDWEVAERIAGVEFDSEQTNEKSYDSVWGALRSGEISKKECWEGYRSNLEFMLPDVVNLAGDLAGKSVISSDHGNMFGEKTITGRPVYKHPAGLRTSELLEVPWAVIDSSDRKDISNGGVKSRSSMTSDLIEARLNALGYVDK